MKSDTRPTLADPAGAPSVIEIARKYIELRQKADSDDVDIKAHRAWQRFAYLNGEEIATALIKAHEALEKIGAEHACGCWPCTGQCTSQQALQATVDEMRDIARAALTNPASEDTAKD